MGRMSVQADETSDHVRKRARNGRIGGIGVEDDAVFEETVNFGMESGFNTAGGSNKSDAVAGGCGVDDG